MILKKTLCLVIDLAQNCSIDLLENFTPGLVSKMERFSLCDSIFQATGVGSTLFTVEGVDNDRTGGGNNFFSVISFSVVGGNIVSKRSLVLTAS